MKPAEPIKNYQRSIAYIGPFMIHNIDIKKPSVVAWWSAAYPGFGHLILDDYVIGVILLIHEEAINAFSHLNAGIFYTFTGQFNQAVQIIEAKWLLAYVPPYIFAIWNSYQATKRLNEDYILARQSDAEIYTPKMSLVSSNRLEEKRPFTAVFWSLLAPGLGHIYINRVLVALLVVPFLVLVLYQSELLPAVHYTFTGDWTAARDTTNPQWLMNLPSIYGFTAYDAYLKTTEYNKLYKLSLHRNLETSYQHRQFQMPI